MKINIDSEIEFYPNGSVTIFLDDEVVDEISPASVLASMYLNNDGHHQTKEMATAWADKIKREIGNGC